jgi:hypothetical protein
MAQLAKDQEFQEAAAEREAELQAKVSVWREAERPIVDDLHLAGVGVASVWDLVNLFSLSTWSEVATPIASRVWRGRLRFSRLVSTGSDFGPSTSRPLGATRRRVWLLRWRPRLPLKTSMICWLCLATTPEEVPVSTSFDRSSGSEGCVGDRSSRRYAPTQCSVRKQPCCCPDGSELSLRCGGLGGCGCWRVVRRGCGVVRRGRRR